MITDKKIIEEKANEENGAFQWTRSYFVSTAGNVSTETIKRYIDEQRKE